MQKLFYSAIAAFISSPVNAYTPTTILVGKEHQNIYVNRPFKELQTYMDENDGLIFWVLNKLEFQDERLTQQWSMLDKLLEDILGKLEGGYVTTFYYDCVWAVK